MNRTDYLQIRSLKQLRAARREVDVELSQMRTQWHMWWGGVGCDPSVGGWIDRVCGGIDRVREWLHGAQAVYRLFRSGFAHFARHHAPSQPQE